MIDFCTSLSPMTTVIGNGIFYVSCTSNHATYFTGQYRVILDLIGLLLKKTDF